MPAIPALARFYRRRPPAARVALFLLGCVALSLAWGATLGVLLRPGSDVLVRPDRYPLVANAYLAGTYLILMAGSAWCWLRLQGASLSTLGWSGDARWALRLLQGAALGLFSLGALFAVELARGWLLWDASAWARTPGSLMLVNALTALFFGISEEALFRGFILSTLARHRGAGGAIIASAWLFATSHFLRFDLKFVQLVPPWTGLFLAGLLLALLRRRTRSIWLGAGLHASWVYLFFLSDRQKLLVYPLAWNWATGGGYPLAGASAIAMLLLMTAIALSWRQERPSAEAPAPRPAEAPGYQAPRALARAAGITEA